MNNILKRIKRDGIRTFLLDLVHFLRYKVFIVFSYLPFNKKKYQNQIKQILSRPYSRIVLWRSEFGWDVPLFQRPQHIALCLSKQDTLVLYEVTQKTDFDVFSYQEKNSNLFLVNFSNQQFSRCLEKELINTNIPKYIQIYSTEWKIGSNYLAQKVNQGYKILYEYIDDLNPTLTSSTDLLPNVVEKYNYAIDKANIDNVLIVVTADELETDVVSKRGTKNMIYAGNGVDINHFATVEKNTDKLNRQMKEIVELKKPIIGYYGAIASWFDYQLINKLAVDRPDYQIVIIGVNYDKSSQENWNMSLKNIHLLSPIDYQQLPSYAVFFDVCMIPFQVNEITNATSPLKLFEYMAMEKPIVTTAMKECKKYESVLIAKDIDEFIKQVDYALQLNKEKDRNYFSRLKKEAVENTWEQKTNSIISLLARTEQANGSNDYE